MISTSKGLICVRHLEKMKEVVRLVLLSLMTDVVRMKGGCEVMDVSLAIQKG